MSAPRLLLVACLVIAVIAALASGRAVAETKAVIDVEAWALPPGSRESPTPSDEIFPAQSVPIRFSHKQHVKGIGVGCRTCHVGAATSDASSDSLLPKPSTCDNCHASDHTDLDAVKGGVATKSEADGRCPSCHVGDDAGKDGRVARVVAPAPNLVFSHKKHAVRNIGCGQCHGRVEELDAATRDQLPRMAGCLTCHDKPGAARGDAKGECVTCHVTQPDGRLRVVFASGSLLPPPWLRGAAHDADWSERHKVVAGEDSAFCGACHTTSECADCHDGKVRPRRVHPNDWLSMHAQAARQDNPRCSGCHAEQTFCGDCHRRTGVARDSPSGNRPTGRRFHPPPSQWTTAPRTAMHHAWEAMRNLNACVSCHSERDCASCHATRGLAGGAGVSPHPPGFREKCGGPLRLNPRPCLVCHTQSDRALRMCR